MPYWEHDHDCLKTARGSVANLQADIDNLERRRYAFQEKLVALEQERKTIELELRYVEEHLMRAKNANKQMTRRPFDR